MARPKHPVRHRVYEILERGAAGDSVAAAVHFVLIALVLVNVAAVVLVSVPALMRGYGMVFIALEIATIAIFTVEYGLRLWCAPEHGPLCHMPPWRARRKLALQPQSIIDFAAILPFYFAFLELDGLQTFLLLRLFRFFKLARYSTGLASLAAAVRAEKRAIAACAIILLGTVLLCASLMHFAEREVQPERFGTIPDAMYWAIVTLTTVGYGDVVPVTALGQVIAGLTAVAGLVMLALPVGIIASAFAREIHRHDFVVTWGMVARVPIFSELAAQDVGEIMRLLRSRSCEAGEIVCRRGEEAHAMYFIAAGQVEISLKEPAILNTGDFFGEAAALKRRRRTATVRALTASKLLVLEAADLHHLMERNPAMASRIEHVARLRESGDRVVRHGAMEEGSEG